MDSKQKVKFLELNGWVRWNDNYWVNPTCVEDHHLQDYTKHGVDMETAFNWETKKWPPLTVKIKYGEHK